VRVIAFRVESIVQTVIFFPLLVMKVFALADAIYRKDALFAAAEKQNKAFWIILLVLSLVLQLLWRSPLALMNLLGTVAAGVYLADVRPRLQSLRHY
jgi:hypothetical protein